MTISTQARSQPGSTLQTMEVHDAWIRDFRTPEIDRFLQMAFDYIAEWLGPPGEVRVLDAGCGSGTKSLHLSCLGFAVLGLDFSTATLKPATKRRARLSGRVEFQQGDLTALHLPTDNLRSVICLGVMMHAPTVERAIAELARVLAPGGTLAISEGNLRSV